MELASNKQIFILYSCNDWEESDSMSIVCISTCQSKIKRAIVNEIKNGHMEYSSEELSISKQIKMFKDDWNKSLRKDINGLLKYGFYDYFYDGVIY